MDLLLVKEVKRLQENEEKSRKKKMERILKEISQKNFMNFNKIKLKFPSEPFAGYSAKDYETIEQIMADQFLERKTIN